MPVYRINLTVYKVEEICSPFTYNAGRVRGIGVIVFQVRDRK